METTTADTRDEEPAMLAPLLSAHHRVTSTEIAALHAAVEPLAVGHDLQPVKRGTPLDGIVNGLSLGTVNLVWVRYGGSGVIVETPPTEGEFAMCVPVAPMAVEYNSRRRREVARGSLVLSHDERMHMSPHPYHGCLVIATTTGRLIDHLAAYLGEDTNQPLHFNNHGGPAITAPAVMAQTWQHACDILDRAGPDGIHPFAARSLEDFILTTILLGHPNTATARLAGASARPNHRLACLIRDWLEAHHHQPIGVADIAAAVGISIRRVQAICQHHWAQTPTQLLRGIRLDHARAALIAAHPTHRAITYIAATAGYTHMSRFAAHYRQRFGETPTQTLNNATYGTGHRLDTR